MAASGGTHLLEREEEEKKHTKRRPAATCARKHTTGRMADMEDLRPCVPCYFPASCRVPARRLWCACGLSRTQPWCDGSHRGTGFRPLPFDPADKQQALFSICNCKYTSTPPFCDGSHIDLPLRYRAQIDACTADHALVQQLCTKCGFRPRPAPGPAPQ
jgi:CDGSH-type Zn-finger protein